MKGIFITMGNMPRIVVKCKDCGDDYELSYRRVKELGEDHHWRCKKCYKYWRKNNWFNSLSKDKQKEISEKRSEINKNMWAGKTDIEIESIKQSISNTRKNKSPEEKKLIKAKYRNTWFKKGEEFLKEHEVRSRINTKKFWDDMTTTERELFSNKLSIAQKEYLANMSDGERELLRQRKSQKSKNWWNNLSDQHRSDLIKNMSAGTKEQWMNKTSAERNIIAAKISEARKKYWRDLDHDGYLDWREKYMLGYTQYLKNINSIPNQNEMSIIKYLNMYGIPYDYQYYNTIKHPDFDTIFPFNTVTKSPFVSPYHAWDFIIYNKLGDILIDIDGSIHANPSYSKISPYTNEEYQILDYHKFNDSQRPYQTDGLDAYVIQCYDDELKDDTEVLCLKDNTIIKFNKFKSLLYDINIINTMNDDSISKLINI